MNDKNLTEIAINGYYIYISDGKIKIMKRLIQNLNYLHIKFDNVSYNG